jgi:hypothetical protein
MLCFVMRGPEQRREPRHQIEAVVGSVDPPVEGQLVNMSTRGACVVLPWPRAVGPRLTLSIRAKDKSTILHGTVRWQRQVTGGRMVGVEFG